jgi:putative nucleotidyltransferase with HDIG domain
VDPLSKKYPVYELVEGMITDESIYSSGDVYVSLISKNTVLTNYLIGKLVENGVTQVKILEPSGQNRLIDIPKSPPVISPRLRHEVVGYLHDLFSIAEGKNEDTPFTAQTVKQLDTIVGQLVSAMSRDQRAIVNIYDLKSYDEYTYHHSLSVSVLSIAIAQRLGYDAKMLTKIGKCSLMHDIGKTRIPIDIINKTSKLDPDEFTIVKNHSMEGYKYLLEKHIGDEELWAGVKYHHEKYDGTGYPDGIAGEDIPLMSRIISVADVYDALTSKRPYRKPMQPADALEYVMGGASAIFDFDIVTAFLEKMEPYPLGSIVELSNGKIAVVINNEFPKRPVVQTLDGGVILDLYNDRKCLDLVIINMFLDQPQS